MPVTVQRVVECVHDVETKQEKMVLIVGKPGSGKSKVMRELATMRGWKYIDSRDLLTDELMELVPKARAQEAPHMISKVLGLYNADVIVLDGIQVLFTPVLQLEPMDLLKQLSRKHTIVAAWPGDYDNGKLNFLQNGQDQALSYEAGDLMLIQIG